MKSLVNKIQCDKRECVHCTDEDMCNLKEIETDNDGNCIEVNKHE